MSYEVIARRWRPQEFQGLIGQDHIRQTLLNALRAKRLPHALLFTGPRGTGKTSTARILAKAVRCPNAVDFVPCNKCSECEEISCGRSVNVIEIDGASNNGVDAIRELRETIGYMPSSGKFKIYIIDEVHMLSTSAFNALLKTLEEPPEHIFFVMATTEAHKIPNTILSRVQRFDFRRIPTKAIADQLGRICESDGKKAEPEALWAIARQGDGSMRDAQSLLEQVINFCEGELTLSKTTDILGLTDRHLLVATWSALLSRNSGDVVEQIRKLFHLSLDPKIFVQDLLEEIRHTLLLKIAPEKTELVDLPESEKEELRKLSANLTIEDIHFLFDMALKGAQDLLRASDPKLVLEMVLLRMAEAPRIVSLSSMTGGSAPTRSTPSAPPRQGPPQQQKQTQHAAAASPPTAHHMPAAPLPTEPPPAGKMPDSNLPNELKWKQLVEQIKSVNGLLGAQLENVYVTEIKDDIVKVAIPGKLKFLFDKLNQPDFKKKVGNYIQTYWGKPHRLDIALAESSESTSASTPTPKAIAQQAEADDAAATRAAVENHPLVKSVNQVFKTEIKSIQEINQ
jgi:DNA polymerase III subunit gamma/tau